jgi:transcription termination/antitermination protein NusG
MIAQAGAPMTKPKEAMQKKWYAVQTYSQSEKRAKANLQERIKLKNMEQFFGEILIPTEQVTEARAGGKSRTREHPSFPGYIFVEMDLNDETWHLVKDTSKIMGFVGGPGGKDPIEVKQSQIEDLRKGISEGAAKPKAKVTFVAGDEVRVIDGPFSNFTGAIEEVKPEKQKVRVKVSIFGRSTPVELDFSQVEKKRA